MIEVLFAQSTPIPTLASWFMVILSAVSGVGGMLAVSSERYADWMFGLVGVWSMVVTAVTGK